MLSTFLHQMEAANIVLFLCHFSRDPFILNAICETAGSLFTAHPPCELDRDVKNLPVVNVGKHLGIADPEENRQALMKQADESAVMVPKNLATNSELSVAAACEIDKLNEQLN